MSLLDLPTAAAQPLAGRVILLAGAHGGLGAAAAQACAAAGATLVLLGRKLPKLNRVYDAVAQAGPEPLLYPLDLEGASPDDYLELAQRIQSELGRTPLEHTDPAAFARAVHVNLTAPWWLVQACLPLLRQAPDAALVLAVDDPQRVGQAYWGGYGVAQHGLRALLGMLSAELANTAVRVAGLQPGPMRTGLRARAYAEDHDRRLADAAAYAGACVTLLSPAGAAHRGTIWAPEADALPA